MSYRLLSVAVLLVLVMQGMVSCSTCSRTNPDDFVVPDSVRNVLAKISDKLMQDIVENIASPIETASLIKSLNVPFSQRYLASTKNTSHYHTSYSKAFNLGVFGADLGYLNMYNKTTLVPAYILAMKNLADEINIGQFFNYGDLKRLADNNENIDSLVYISQQSFNKMDRYLRKSGRGNLSVVMISGVWIEALYLSGQFYKESSNARLAESIGEQELMLDELLRMLDYYKREKEIANLISELNVLKTFFTDIKITIQQGDLEQIEKDGTLTIVQNETTIVHYTEAQISEIIAAIENVRNQLIK